jgi:hypothetical protein
MPAKNNLFFYQQMRHNSIVIAGGPAFPMPSSIYPNGSVLVGCPGMTLRAWFAGRAIQTMKLGEYDAAGMATDAVRIADALIAELEKTQ